MKSIIFSNRWHYWSGVFAACNDNDVENFDNQVYINGSAMTSTVLLKNTVSDTEGSFRISMARPESQDITIALKRTLHW